MRYRKGRRRKNLPHAQYANADTAASIKFLNIMFVTFCPDGPMTVVSGRVC
jgi:hypothetical protein